MENSRYTASQTLIYYRLIALWVVCEAFLGGMIHGLKLPVSGLVVGSGAIVCISLIAWHFPAKGMFLKATLIVAIFKMMLSPHSPLPAYFAVFFQGFVAELLFHRRINYKLSCIFFGMIAMLESALQRIAVMTIIYGKQVWTAINDFVNGFTQQNANYSYWLIAFYLAAHLLVGLIVGSFVSRLPGKIGQWKLPGLEIAADGNVILEPVKKRSSKRLYFLVTWILLAALLLWSTMGGNENFFRGNIIVQILLRSVLIVLGWVFFIAPLLEKYLKRWLLVKKSRSGEAISNVLQILPSIRLIVQKSWQASAKHKGWTRLSYFYRMVLTNTLHPG